MNRAHRLPGSAEEKRLSELLVNGSMPAGHIFGLTLSNDSTDATNDIAISRGECRTAVNGAFLYNNAPSTLSQHQLSLVYPDAIIKQLDVAWAPSNPSRSGGKSTTAISNTTWHVFAIGGPGVRPDFLFHNSLATASVIGALPQGYCAYRRIGSIIRSGGAILSFVQSADQFLHVDPPLDYNSTTVTSTAETVALTVPSGFRLTAIINATIVAAAARQGYISSLDQNDEAPDTSSAPLATLSTETGGTQLFTPMQIRTNASASIRIRASGANTTMRIATLGWIDDRGRT